MSEDQKTALENAILTTPQAEATAKALLTLEAEDAFKKYEKSKQEFERSRVRAEVNASYVNATRKGVGPRLAVSGTRGKSPIIVSFEQFDYEKPETLPKDHEEFLKVTGVDVKTFTDFLIRGYNAAMYEAASDPLKEFVVATWDEQVQSTFRLAVRNYSRGLGISLDDAVGIIRPGFVAKFGDAV